MGATIRFPNQKISQNRLELYYRAKMIVEKEAENLLEDIAAGAEIEPGSHIVKIIERRDGEKIQRHLYVQKSQIRR